MTFQKNINEKVYKVVGALMEVHKTLGPGHPADFYKKALEIEFTERELSVEKDRSVDVVFKGVLVGKLNADFIIDEALVISVKVEDILSDVEVQQVLRCLSLTNCTMGILANFGGTKIQYKRVLPSSRINENRKIYRSPNYREHGRTRESNPII
ncbi:GxxExxY protein [bacterium]|nr:GxxExxY protein [bacterium]